MELSFSESSVSKKMTFWMLPIYWLQFTLREKVVLFYKTSQKLNDLLNGKIKVTWKFSNEWKILLVVISLLVITEPIWLPELLNQSVCQFNNPNIYPKKFFLFPIWLEAEFWRRWGEQCIFFVFKDDLQNQDLYNEDGFKNFLVNYRI